MVRTGSLKVNLADWSRTPSAAVERAFGFGLVSAGMSPGGREKASYRLVIGD